ncbi:hypothetical protein U5A82_18930 [Sphingobium sp. CR2-8]|uniref:hypothetical protein n=1 Tax=Sphingobium sp. CR2-8 TaxID=1306534 RepID=UPI002DBF5DBB|nr:hypothetical protein [Sphingobium sp. CR2-8]MEC3912473.1 hypothetical protein [Sphingobium sp. CR2-8]
MRHGVVIPLIGLLLVPLLPSPALAQAEPPPERIINLLVYGDDPCPQSKGDEIVVCARKPESERYRIPKKLREKPAVSGGPGWGSQVATMEETQRNATPMGCSAIGGANTGCFAQMMARWFAERRMQESKGEP